MSKIIIKPRGDKLFVKTNITSPWEPAKLAELKTILSNRKIPFSKEEKFKLQQFGFGRKKSEKSNQQIYPTHHVVIDLDTPNDQKKSLLTEEGFKKWSRFFIKIYKRIIKDEEVPY